MKIKYFENLLETQTIAKGVLRLLEEYDDSFVPPLSHRNSSTQKNLGVDNQTSQNGVLDYFNTMKEQNIFVVLDEETEEVAGFMSMRKDYISDVVREDLLPNMYISTIIVHEKYRGKKLTESCYNMCIEQFPMCNILTRTWSNNTSHIKILDKLHFDQYFRIENDRGAGVDTVYFLRKRTE